jgi:hypothetical protein
VGWVSSLGILLLNFGRWKMKNYDNLNDVISALEDISSYIQDVRESFEEIPFEIGHRGANAIMEDLKEVLIGKVGDL